MVSKIRLHTAAKTLRILRREVYVVEKLRLHTVGMNNLATYSVELICPLFKK